MSGALPQPPPICLYGMYMVNIPYRYDSSVQMVMFLCDTLWKSGLFLTFHRNMLPSFSASKLEA